jgi:hypothetical protein
MQNGLTISDVDTTVNNTSGQFNFKNVARLLLAVAGVYYCLIIPIVQLVLTPIAGGEVANSVGLSMMVLQPISMFLDDQQFSTYERIVEYMGFSGGLIPFLLTLSFAAFRSEILWEWKILIYVIIWFGFVVLMAFCVSTFFAFFFVSLALFSAIEIGCWFRNMRTRISS